MNMNDDAPAQLDILRHVLTSDYLRKDSPPFESLLNHICQCVSASAALAILFKRGNDGNEDYNVHSIRKVNFTLGNNELENSMNNKDFKNCIGKVLNSPTNELKNTDYIKGKDEIQEFFGLKGMESVILIPIRFTWSKHPLGMIFLFKKEGSWQESDFFSLVNIIHSAGLIFVQSIPVYPDGIPYIGQRNVSVMFADMRDSTPLTEILMNNKEIRYSGNEGKSKIVGLTDIMNEFLITLVSKVNTDKRAWIDKFTGDGLEVIFDNDLGEYKDENSPMRAICTAMGMQKAFKKLCKEKWEGWLQEFKRKYSEYIPLGLGIGIDYGPVVLDVFGSGIAYQYTAIGDHVNTASRLESIAAKTYENTGKLDDTI